MIETPEERTHRLNANRGNGVLQSSQFGHALIAEPTAVLVLPEAPYWDNGGSKHGVAVVESPVSDRERNYALVFDTDGGYINVEPFEFGIAAPGAEFNFNADRDRLFIGTEDDPTADTLHVQYCFAADVDYLSAVVEDVDEDTLKAVEASVLAALQEEFGEGIAVEYSSGGERWDDVSVMYSTRYPAQRELDGRLNAFTSNIMFGLEENEKYLKVRDGRGEQIIWDALREHGVEL